MERDRLFVEINDWYRKLVDGHPPRRIAPFICECADVNCHASVCLTLREFDERRSASPPVPVHAAEHDR
jgi:hypothetical protein